MVGVGIIRPLTRGTDSFVASRRCGVGRDGVQSQISADYILSGLTAYRLQIGQKIIV